MSAKAKQHVSPDITRTALQLQFKSSLYLVAKYLCGYSLVNERTHGAMISALEAPTDRKLIVMPRGTFKTSIAVVAYTVYRLINDPNLRILIDSEIRELSVLSLREVKDHIKSDTFQAVFPGWGFKLDNEAKCILNTRTQPKKEPSIAASGIGAGKTGQHYDIIIADDLNSPLNSFKEETASQVINHYRYYTSILDPGGTIVVSGTRYSELDLIAHLIKTEIDV